MLKLKNVSVYYGKAMALEDISIEVKEGSIVCIIGANGAGKSTMLRTVSGLKPLSSGDILFNDRKIEGANITEIVKLGIIHIPEGRRLFPFLSVLTNLKLGASLRKDKAGIKEDMNEILERFPVLMARRNQKAGTLSGGEQQMLAIGRGLMAKPKLLMLDEPSVGLSPLMVENVAHIVKDINNRGVTILLVEQNISLAFGVASRGYALQVGEIIFQGEIDQFKGNEIVKKTYLGG
ncbi:ABC transporter ATP-binding protein [Thermodesulfobacteriota bacterium]